MALLPVATFQGRCAATPEGLRRSPSAAVKLTAVDCPDTGIGPQTAALWQLLTKKRGLSATGKERGIYEKKFIYRNGEAA